MAKQRGGKTQAKTGCDALWPTPSGARPPEAGPSRIGEVLSESQELSRGLIEAATVGTYILQDGRFEYVNPEYAHISGYTADELIGTNSLDHVHPDDREMVRQRAIQHLKGLNRTPYEFRLLRKDRDIAWVVERVASIQYKGKRASVGTFLDITEWKRIDKALREREHDYQTLCECTLDGLFVIDAETFKVVFANRAAADMYGFDSVDDAIGVNPLDFIPADEQERAVRIIVEDMFEKDLREANEFRTVGQGGTELWVSAVGTKTEYEGRPAGLISLRDITERKGVEQRLQRSEASLRRIIETNPDGMMIVDKAGMVRFVNRAAEALFGRRRDELASQLFGFPTIAGEKTEIELLPKDGGRAIVEMRVAETEWEGETGFVASLRDVTDRKRAEQALRNSLETLMRMVGQTVNVLASVVEVRDPATAGHQRRVAQLASAIASEMGLMADEISGIYMAGLIHDVGAIHTSPDILAKPGQLNEAEFSIIKEQPRVAFDILKTIEFPWPVAEMVLQHRERMDGSGYPAGLSGEDILLEARILGVADVVEAMTSDRSHRRAPGIHAALEELSKNRGVLYDSQVVDTCLKLFREKGFRFVYGVETCRE